MEGIEGGLKVLDDYISSNYPMLDKDSEPFQNYLKSAKYILNCANILVIPKKMETNKSKDDTKNRRVFKCIIFANDLNFGKGIQAFNITLDSGVYKTFDGLRDFLENQIPLLVINAYKKEDKEAFRENFRLLLAGFDAIYGLPVSYYIERIGFDTEDKNLFIATNGTLNIQTKEFIPGENILTPNPSIKLDIPWEQMEKLTLDESLEGMTSLVKYVSTEIELARIVVGHFVCGIFRDEYRNIHNEFPFLGIQAISQAGKTSIINFFSWICCYDWESVEGTGNTGFASVAGMDYTSGWYYFFDEIQQLSNGQLRSIQSAYNSGKSYKGGKGNWREIGGFNRDCNLICTGEHLPQNEEALLNRYIIINSKKPFKIVMNVTEKEEFEKYELITGEKINVEYLNTDMIKVLAREYYRPRFMNILKYKKEINFREFHDQAIKLIDDVVKLYDRDNQPSVRVKNNLIPAITGLLMLRITPEDISKTIKRYFDNFMEYRKDVFISGKVQKYIINHIGEFCSWIGKVKSGDKNYPMIYLKYTDGKQGLIMQLSRIPSHYQKMEGCTIDAAIIQQQLRGYLGITGIKSVGNKVANSMLNNMNGTFVPIEIIKDVGPLKEIRDAALDYIGNHVKELEQIYNNQYSNYVMDKGGLEGLIKEMNETYEKAEFFDTTNYSKEIEKDTPF